jgi:DNA-binding SARP family transcriptional activator
MQSRVVDALTQEARLFVMTAPPGYDKIRTMRHYAMQHGTFAVCDFALPESRTHAFSQILAALEVSDPVLQGEAASARLQSGDHTAIDVVRDAWKRAPLRPGVLMIRDAGGLLSAIGLELVSELVATAVPQRRIVLAFAAPLPPGHAFNEAPGIAVHELEIAGDAEFALETGTSNQTAGACITLARRIPLAARCFAFAEKHVSLDGVRTQTLSLNDAELVEYALDAAIAALDTVRLQTLFLLAQAGDATTTMLRDLVGPPFGFGAAHALARLPFIDRAGESFFIHPLAARELRARFPDRLKRAVGEAIDRAVAGDAIVTAATLALRTGDAERAAQIVDVREPADIPIALHERIGDRLGRSALPRFSAIWLATIPFRRFAVDRATYLREARLVYHCLPPNVTTQRRAQALMHLASAERNEARSDSAFALIDEGLRGFASEPSAARASLLTLAATLHGVEGRFARAREFAREAAAIERTDFHDDLVLHYIDVHEAFFRGWYDRGFVVIDEVLRRNRQNAGPLYVAYAAMNGAIFAWAAGDDERYKSYIGALEDALTPGLERGFAPVLDGFHQRPIAVDGYAWPVQTAIGQLLRMGAATAPEQVLEHARAALIAADACQDPFLQMLAGSSLVALGETAGAPALRAIVSRVEAPEARTSVDALLAGVPDLGILAPLITGRLQAAAIRATPQLRVELLTGRVFANETELALTPKELELLIFLAASRTPVSRDAIGESLWPHVDEDGWANNIKVTISRIRRKCGAVESIVIGDGGYRLSPDSGIDLRTLESMLRSVRSNVLTAAIEHTFRNAFLPYRSGIPARLERYDWLAPTLVRIRDVATSIGLALARVALERSESGEAAELAQALLAIDEFSEDAFLIALGADLARDARSAARQRARRFVEQLAAGGLEISPATQAVIDAI